MFSKQKMGTIKRDILIMVHISSPKKYFLRQICSQKIRMDAAGNNNHSARRNIRMKMIVKTIRKEDSLHHNSRNPDHNQDAEVVNHQIKRRNAKDVITIKNRGILSFLMDGIHNALWAQLKAIKSKDKMRMVNLVKTSMVS